MTDPFCRTIAVRVLYFDGVFLVRQAQARELSWMQRLRADWLVAPFCFGGALALAARHQVLSATSDATKYRMLSSQENIWDTEQHGL